MSRKKIKQGRKAAPFPGYGDGYWPWIEFV